MLVPLVQLALVGLWVTKVLQDFRVHLDQLDPRDQQALLDSLELMVRQGLMVIKDYRAILDSQDFQVPKDNPGRLVFPAVAAAQEMQDRREMQDLRDLMVQMEPLDLLARLVALVKLVLRALMDCRVTLDHKVLQVLLVKMDFRETRVHRDPWVI